MDMSLQESELAVADGDASRTAQQKPVARRLVQSTIFGIGSPGSVKGEGQTDGDDEEDTAKKGTRNRKAMSQQREEARSSEHGKQPEVGDCSLQSPVRRSLRRRSFQSTLLHHGSHDDEIERGEGGVDANEENSGEEDHCGSQGKKKQRKGGCKSKPGPQSRTSKKVSVNQKESPITKIDDNHRSDFFQKASKKRLKGRQQKHQQFATAVEGNYLICSPEDSIPVRQTLEFHRPVRSPPTVIQSRPGLMDLSLQELELPVADGDASCTPHQKPVARRLVQSTIFGIGSPGSVKGEDQAGGDDEVVAAKKGTRKCKAMSQQREEVRSSEHGKQLEVGDCSLQLPVRRSLRRRSFQSTLLPHGSHDKEIERGEGGADANEENSGEEDYCGSQGKKQRKRGCKSKPGPQSRTSEKVSVNQKESRITKIDGNHRSDFFLKASRKRLKGRQQKHQQFAAVAEGNGLICSPEDSIPDIRSPCISKKQHVKTTPVKSVTSSPDETTLRIVSSSPLQSKCATQIIPDLRSEAKIAAEENSRIFSGREMHPFFSTKKACTKSVDTTEPEANLGLVERTEKCIPFGPMHVFEKVQDENDVRFLDWRNWTFCNRNLFNTIGGMEGAFLSVSEDHVQSLNFDNFQSALHNLYLKASPALADGPMAYRQPQMDVEMDHVINTAGCSSECAAFSDCPDAKQKIISPRKRISSYYLGRDDQPKNSLWTNKYLPEKATEVCGNAESVKFLSEWLRFWHEKDSHSCKNPDILDKSIMQDIYYDSDGSESDPDNIGGGDARLQNVLLVAGPVGSGKSAAIYACAKEQGFQVLELNSSDWRNGALVKQRIGEALESHSLKWSLKNSAIPPRQQLLDSSPGQTLSNGRTSEMPVNEIIDQPHLRNELGCEEDTLRASEENGIVSDQGDRTLLLFEDVDIMFSEDRGFAAAIQELAETAKQPIILTSNSDNPALPINLHRLQVSFNIPSLSELLCYVNMFCAAEKADIQPYLIERLIKCCQGDIRKTIMNIQFWCQSMEGKAVPPTYSPLLFDLDAAHQILPNIIPLSFPSRLSEIVGNMISKSLSTFDQSCMIMEAVEEEESVPVGIQEGFVMQKNEKDNIKVKKDTLLSRNSNADDINGYIPPFDGTCEFSNSNSMCLTHWRAIQSSCSPSTSQLFDVDREKMEEICNQCEGTENGQSFFPEASFVPETEIDDEKKPVSGTNCCSDGSDILGGDTTTKSKEIHSTVEANNHEKSASRSCENLKLMGINWGSISDSINVEVVGDSQMDNVEAVAGGCQMLDESSCIDFSSRSKSIKNRKSQDATDFVQDTWRELRGHETDLRQHVTLMERENLRTLNLVSDLSCLLSETDLLQSDCQQLLCDVLKPEAVPLEESKTSCWYDKQLHMTSATAQHGFCLYVKNIAALQRNMKTNLGVDLIQEMLASTSNTMALGKLIGCNVATNRVVSAASSIEAGHPTNITSLRCEEHGLGNIFRSVVPMKSHLSLKSDAMHEYLSYLGQISRSETNRLSEGIDKTKRRRRWVAPHYLGDGALMLSPEDILLLDQYGCHWKNSSRVSD